MGRWARQVLSAPDKPGRALKIEFREFMFREPCRQIFLSVHFAPLNDADWVRLTPSRERRRVASEASCREEADLGFGTSSSLLLYPQDEAGPQIGSQE
jgi:hypothetical protein